MRYSFACLLFLVIGCKDPGTARDVARDVLTAGEIACVLLHGDQDAGIVADLCHIDRALIPVIGSTLGAHRQGVGVSPRVGLCPPH